MNLFGFIKDLKQQHLVAFFLSLCFVVFVFIAAKTNSSFGGADNFVHYRISRYAFSYPYLFFDHWGKPFFTILSAPFAQLGYLGLETFNILCGILSGWFAFKTAEKLGLKFSWLAPVILFGAPMYFFSMFSAMTEPLFGLLLVVSIYYFIAEKYWVSAIILSFIPFARTEGIIFFPLFIFALLLLRQWKILPLLLVGFVIISLAGATYYEGDWLWFVHKNPYTGARDLYGSGTFWHFFNESKFIFGYPIIILTLTGIAFALFGLFLNTKLVYRVNVLLILSCTIGYFMAHTVVWWLGMNGSAGLVRVIISIVPLVAIIALFAIEIIPEMKWLKVTLLFGVLFFVVKEPIQQKLFKLELGVEEKVFKKATDYLIENKLDKNYVVYYNSVITFFLDKDPFDNSMSREKVYNIENPSDGFPDHAIIIWDSHLGPNEGGLPLENLRKDPNLKLLNVFDPNEVFNQETENEFRVYIFEKER